MLATTALAQGAAERGFPRWLRVTHLSNLLLIGLLVSSRWEILAWGMDGGTREDSGYQDIDART